MNKINIKVPKGIQFISDWKEYFIPRGKHVIVDKGVTGCGYTEYCLTNDDNIILCSPRLLLLENKIAQHKNDKNIYYAKNDIKDIESKNRYEERLYDHIIYCQDNNLPCKILVSYDSLHYVIEFLEKIGLIKEFISLVDEFQSIFLDSFFKAEVELDFVETLQQCNSVVYLSATPMLDKYLEKLDQFKDLDFYKFDWSETGFVETINVQRKKVNSLGVECGKIIEAYLRGDYPIALNDKNEVIQSKEAVFYFNSVTEIVRLISKYDLKSDNTRVICSDTIENRKKLKRLNLQPEQVPLKDEQNPMFMFCTSTCYVGVDFYSKCAKSYIFADPNITSLALDISLDLPQIIGRQRDKSNPFKNDIIIFYKVVRHKEDTLTEENFKRLQDQRMESTRILLGLYDKATSREKTEYIYKLRDSIEVSKYFRDFVSISRHTNEPAYNPLIDLAYQRAWEVSQKEYQDSLTVTKSISEQGFNLTEFNSREESVVSDFLDNHFYKTGVFEIKMRIFCEFMDKYKGSSYIYDAIKHRIPDQKYLKYYNYYGTKGCSARRYREKELSQGLKNSLISTEVDSMILDQFKVGDNHSKVEIKSRLQKIYTDLGIMGRKPKATDLEQYFKLSPSKVLNSENKWVHSFKLGKKDL